MFTKFMGIVGIIYAICMFLMGLRAMLQTGKYKKDENLQRHGFYESVGAVLLLILSIISIYFSYPHFFIRF